MHVIIVANFALEINIDVIITCRGANIKTFCVYNGVYEIKTKAKNARFVCLFSRFISELHGLYKF